MPGISIQTYHLDQTEHWLPYFERSCRILSYHNIPDCVKSHLINSFNHMITMTLEDAPLGVRYLSAIESDGVNYQEILYIADQAMMRAGFFPGRAQHEGGVNFYVDLSKMCFIALAKMPEACRVDVFSSRYFTTMHHHVVCMIDIMLMVRELCENERRLSREDARSYQSIHASQYAKYCLNKRRF